MQVPRGMAASHLLMAVLVGSLFGDSVTAYPSKGGEESSLSVAGYPILAPLGQSVERERRSPGQLEKAEGAVDAAKETASGDKSLQQAMEEGHEAAEGGLQLAKEVEEDNVKDAMAQRKKRLAERDPVLAELLVREKRDPTFKKKKKGGGGGCGCCCCCGKKK